jgi:hypothetical protein
MVEIDIRRHFSTRRGEGGVEKLVTKHYRIMKTHTNKAMTI